ncbi:MAG: hypothetical protein KGZ50_06405 [Peptococcaceae bacterium]|nr:hypothetical protein [Peptococcaceae bacterium]
MSRRYLGKTGAPYMGSACHVTPLPGKGAATHTGGCSAGTKAGDLGGAGVTDWAVIGLHGVTRRVGSACHVTPLPGKGATTHTGGCSAGTRAGDLGHTSAA